MWLADEDTNSILTDNTNRAGKKVDKCPPPPSHETYPNISHRDFLSYIFNVSEKYKDYTFDYGDMAV